MIVDRLARADGLLADLAAGWDGDESRSAAQLRGIIEGRAGHRGQRNVLDGDQLRRNRRADGDRLLGDENLGGGRDGRGGVAAVVQEHDDANERQHGEQHPNQDHQAIGSLHGYTLLELRNTWSMRPGMSSPL